MSDSSIPWTSTTDDFDELWQNADDGDAPDFVPDMLVTMFAQQMEHMREYADIQHTTPKIEPHQWGDIQSPLVQAKIRETAGYTVEELYEAVNLLKNKPWKQSLRDTDREAFLEELADVWHFFIELHHLAGVDPEEVFRQYFLKTLKNTHRRAGGY
ncbi:dUTPase [Gordonia phage Nibbles]|uniref:dUTPase n=1 Tax=Gordonia phage Azira TaxID=3035369 RepID=A0AAF0K0E6_9CAUD|nr:dUTPase [Gordonia phage Azira]WGH21052.1 dUTPase [Gordonia phage Azira]WNM75495.1 dUTPase [Gordonia phage Nibbles]